MSMVLVLTAFIVNYSLRAWSDHGARPHA